MNHLRNQQTEDPIQFWVDDVKEIARKNYERAELKIERHTKLCKSINE